jgi:hypothetical protein
MTAMKLVQRELINIYCDESCHLERDGEPIMVLGAVSCPAAAVKQTHREILEIMRRHGAAWELKWVKVNRPRMRFYTELIDYFFDNPKLNFRAWLVENKAALDHEFFNQGSHDSFYYKMYFYMLKPLLRRPNRYHIYLDKKDTRSATKVKELGEVLKSANYDWSALLVSRLQTVESHDVPLLQLADLLIGALAYRNRPEIMKVDSAKYDVMRHVAKRYGRELIGNTPPWETKFNFYTFSPQTLPQ